MRRKIIILTIQAIASATLIGIGAGLGLLPCVVVGVIILGSMIITTLSHEPSTNRRPPLTVINPVRVLV
jgi:hypothetical protein